MNVTLVHHTPDAATLLIFTKQTRLNMSPGLYEEIRNWSEEKKALELAYMAKTIPSSWEFINCTFLIEGVSRACAQQITRTRTASYAMQSQRVTDVSAMGVVPAAMYKDTLQRKVWDLAVEEAKASYKMLIADGMSPQDARGLLPMNVECNLVAQYNLRSLTDLLKARQSLRAQGEYVEVARLMKERVLAVWPWSEPFFTSPHDTAIAILEAVAKEIGITTGKGPGWEIAKAIDLLRKE